MRGWGCVSVVALAAAAVSVTAQQPPQVFRAATRTVAIYATVQDRSGALATDLVRDDFQILDNAKPVEITTFSNEIVPITAVLLLDMSHSMARRYAHVRAAAQYLVGGLLPDDRLRIGTFGREVNLSPLLTGNRSVLLRVLDEELWPGGSTPIWRAAVDGMSSLAGEPGRRVIVIVTDGVTRDDANCAPASNRATGPCTDSRDVARQAQRDEVMVYAVGFAAAGLDADIRRIAEDSGGGYVALADGADLGAAFQRILDELHHQYVLGFTPTVLDGRPRTLEVRILKPGLTARSRKSYVATRSP
jgi:VWFA-related protein